jgi:uncharacterized membrane protein YqjE
VVRPGFEPSADAGFFRHTAELLSAALDYLKARFQLAGIEAKEASIHYVIMLALLIGALVVVIFGYFFLCLALIFLIAWLCGGGNAWIWVTFGMALLHFGGGVACVLIAKHKFAEPMFRVTLQEFRKDQQWLNPPAARTS